MELGAKQICNEFIRELESEESRKLNMIFLLPLVEKIINNKYAINYLDNEFNELDQIKCKIFTYLYKQIIIDNEKKFINLSNIEDLCLSILFCIYH